MDHRVFIALPLISFLPELKSCLSELASKNPNVKWTDFDYFHVTLHFFSKVSDDLLEDMKKATSQEVSEFESFHLGLKDLGVFPDLMAPKVLWAGLNGDVNRLKLLQTKLGEAFKGLGLPVDERPFSPHGTLGRVRNDTGSSLNLEGVLLSTSSHNISEAFLYESRLSPSGSAYQILARFPFK